MTECLLLKIQNFYQKLDAGIYQSHLDLAKALEDLANSAWDEVDELYQPSIRIDG
ncbi:MAG: hypothetical protein DSM106950_01355 [Stigonema ocellatum SAG 48.90 = DSM 106950]|nr:hypothetical protein [Stigonema ocellatum SAG 48.90 = DSM 106950]